MTYLDVEDVLDNSLMDDKYEVDHVRDLRDMCFGVEYASDLRDLCIKYLQGVEPEVDVAIHHAYLNFVSFWKRSKLNLLVFNPKSLTSKRLECTGTPDIVATDKHGQVFLIQIKLKDWVTQKDWYRAAAWKALWNDNYPKKQATGAVILSLGLKPNDYKVERRDDTSRERVIFEQCLLLKQYIVTKPTK